MLHLYDFVFKKLFLSVSVAFFVFNFDEVLSEFCEYSQKIPQNILKIDEIMEICKMFAKFADIKFS